MDHRGLILKANHGYEIILDKKTLKIRSPFWFTVLTYRIKMTINVFDDIIRILIRANIKMRGGKIIR
jgi:hypothetical protein